MSRRRLDTDERGAILVLGVFMAVFLTATLYYVVGIGDAILQREHMQDAADAAAFSSAVVHARGMNVLALINMVMAALLAVLIALKLVETLTTVALVTISVMSFLEPALAPMIPELAELRQQVHEAGDLWQQEMNVALRALHLAAVGVRDAVPLASELPVITAVKADYAPQVTLPLVVPMRLTLPTKDGTFAELCERANEYLAGFARFALRQVVPKPVAGIVAGALEGLAGAGPDWFCGASGSKPPKTSVLQTAHYPALPSRKLCLDYAPSQQSYDAAEHHQRCDEAERDERDSEPDAASGKCLRRCEPGGPYEQRDALARAACAVRAKGDKLHAFDWQERRFSRSFVFHAGLWRVSSDRDHEEKSAVYERHNTDYRPCGEPLSPVSPDWQSLQRATTDDALLPVCAKAPLPASEAHEGDTTSLEQIEVLRIFGCEEQITHEYDLSKYSGDRITAEADDDSALKRVPQVLEGDAKLGSEDFQLRSIVIGKLPPELPNRMLGLATWKSDPDEGIGPAVFSSARYLGHTSWAQAEYFFDARDPQQADPRDFMWSMRWKARLRRFRLPERAQPGKSDGGGTGVTFESACNTAASKASDIDSQGESPCSSDFSIADLFVH